MARQWFMAGFSKFDRIGSEQLTKLPKEGKPASIVSRALRERAFSQF
jgi:hypothetical protein